MTNQEVVADYDLVIVGASFSGLVAARTAAMRGLRVAVLEAKPEPGARVRTTGILVREAAEVLDLPSELCRRIPGIRLYAPSMASVDLHSPGYSFLATETAALLRWLAREASLAGADLHFSHRFQGADRGFGRVVLPGLGTTRFLIGADGANSAVARAFGLGRNQLFLTGVEWEFPAGIGLDPGYLHCFLDRRIAPGYIAWAVPGVGVTQVGMACAQGRKPDMTALMEKLRALLPVTNRVPLERRAGLIPAGGPVCPFASDRVVLIGDAAGLVSPMTAGGIHNAFHFGRRAAQVVADYLQSSGPEPGRVLCAEVPKYRLKRQGRRLLDLGPPDIIFDLLISTPLFRAFARKVYFHHRMVPLARFSRCYLPAPQERRRQFS